MDLKVVLRALLTSVYKMSDGDIDAIQNAPDGEEDAAIASILEKARLQAEATKPKPGQTFQDGYKKAKAEERKAFEAELKEHYGITESTATGADLVSEIVAANSKASEGDQDITKNPAFQKRERELLKQIKDKEIEFNTKWQEKEAEAKKAEVLGTISGFALKMLDSLNPVLPTSAAVATTYRNSFVDDLKKFDYELTSEDPKTANITQNGEIVKDAYGHPVTLADLVKSRAQNYFEFKANNGGANGGNGAPGTTNTGGAGSGSGYPEGIAKPKDFEEVSALLRDRTIPVEQRRQISDAWDAEQTAGTAK